MSRHRRVGTRTRRKDPGARATREPANPYCWDADSANGELRCLVNAIWERFVRPPSHRSKAATRAPAAKQGAEGGRNHIRFGALPDVRYVYELQWATRHLGWFCVPPVVLLLRFAQNAGRPPIKFADVTESSKVRFLHRSSATSQKYFN